MVPISKEEKKALCERFTHLHTVRTMRQKSKRHRYYCEEAPAAMKALRQIRNRNVVETHGRI